MFFQQAVRQSLHNNNEKKLVMLAILLQLEKQMVPWAPS